MRDQYPGVFSVRKGLRRWRRCRTVPRTRLLLEFTTCFYEPDLWLQGSAWWTGSKVERTKVYLEKTMIKLREAIACKALCLQPVCSDSSKITFCEESRDSVFPELCFSLAQINCCVFIFQHRNGFNFSYALNFTLPFNIEHT